MPLIQAIEASDKGDNIGVFVCGPKALASDLRGKLRTLQGKADNQGVKISVHEGK